MQMKTLLALSLGSILMTSVNGCGGGGGGSGARVHENFESYAVQSGWTSPDWTDSNTGIPTIWDVVSDSGNKVLCHAANGGRRIYDLFTGTDYTVSARMKPGNVDTSAGILARFTDGNHYYGLTLETGTLVLRKFPSGAAPAFESFTFDTGTYYTLTLKVAGHLITGRVTDGATTAVVTIDDDGTYDSNPANDSGEAGISEFVHIGSCFDDIKVTEP